MNWFSNIFNSVKRGIGSFLSLSFWHLSPQFNDYSRDVEKLKIVFSNPAALRVFALQCDLFSLAKIYVYVDGVALEEDPALDRLNNPNPLQSKTQFLWDFMFWNMIGNANLYVDSEIVDRLGSNYLYFLENHKIDWPLELDRKKDKLIFSKSAENELMNTEITYRYDDGTTFKFPLKKLLIITDLTNGTGNWFKGFGRIDALYKVLSNSEAGLDATNINTRFTGKFIVAGKSNPEDVTEVPLGQKEKEDVETKINGDTSVHAMKSMIDIKKFVENGSILKQLNESFLASLSIIGSIFNIKRDVIEAYASSTFENQGKATAINVSYTMEPKGQELGSRLEKYWGYDKDGSRRKIVFSWDHLPFNQIFEKDRAVTDNLKAQTFINLRKSGVSLEDANIFLDTNFKDGGDLNGTAKTTTATTS